MRDGWYSNAGLFPGYEVRYAGGELVEVRHWGRSVRLEQTSIPPNPNGSDLTRHPMFPTTLEGNQAQGTSERS